ncbi:hypothetical protein [Rhodoblastus sp.]|uniref:hypothetical protein n=1 Tax=Rhodoblastus sp. TaxID=1962975 RepID=UPI0025D17588|nr:hypothetical protein [Rhodoblastus sp.]
MSKSKSRIALALALGMISAAPAFAWRMDGPQWLRMMDKIRADRSDPQATRCVPAFGNKTPNDKCAAKIQNFRMHH